MRKLLLRVKTTWQIMPMWAKVLDLVFYGMIAIGMAMVIWGWL